MNIRRGLEAVLAIRSRQNRFRNIPRGPSQTQQRRRVVCTRAQDLVAHATTPGAPTIVVTQAIAARHKHICASGPKNVCTLLTASITQLACWLATLPRTVLLLTNRMQKNKHRAWLIRKSLQGVRQQLCAAFLGAALQVLKGFSGRLRPSLRCDCFEQAR